jgi:hypothetical protein
VRALPPSLPLIYRVCLCVASVSSSVSWPLCLPTTADVHRQPHAFSWLQDFRVDVISETDDMIEFDMIGVDAAVVSFDDRKKSDLYFFVSPCHDQRRPRTSPRCARDSLPFLDGREFSLELVLVSLEVVSTEGPESSNLTLMVAIVRVTGQHGAENPDRRGSNDGHRELLYLQQHVDHPRRSPCTQNG